jgi:cell division protease FtsH
MNARQKDIVAFHESGYAIVAESVKNYSAAKAAQIDEEISRLMDEANQRVNNILSDKKALLDKLAALLSIQETVQGDELRKMM